MINMEIGIEGLKWQSEACLSNFTCCLLPVDRSNWSWLLKMARLVGFSLSLRFSFSLSFSPCTLFVVESPTCRLILLCNSTQRLPVICPKCPLRTDVSADRFLTTKNWGTRHPVCFLLYRVFYKYMNTLDSWGEGVGHQGHFLHTHWAYILIINC